MRKIPTSPLASGRALMVSVSVCTSRLSSLVFSQGNHDNTKPLKVLHHLYRAAAIPRIYRLKFQRDIYKDLRILEKSIGEGDEENSNLDLFSLLLPHPVMVQVNSSIKPVSKTIVFRSMANRGNFNENSF